jgi:hypothetical protein
MMNSMSRINLTRDSRDSDYLVLVSMQIGVQDTAGRRWRRAGSAGEDEWSSRRSHKKTLVYQMSRKCHFGHV